MTENLISLVAMGILFLGIYILLGAVVWYLCDSMVWMDCIDDVTLVVVLMWPVVLLLLLIRQLIIFVIMLFNMKWWSR